MKVIKIKDKFRNLQLTSNNPAIIKEKYKFGGYMHEIRIDSIRAVYFENTSSDQLHYDMKMYSKDVLFYYQFSGKGGFGASETERMLLEANEQIYTTSSSDEENTIINLKPHSSCCFFKLESVFINAYLKEIELRWSTKFPYHQHKGSPYHKHELPITPSMRECLEEVFHSKRKGMFLKLHLESLLLRLLLLQFEQMENHDCNVFCSLKKSEVNKIYAAKKIITSHLDQWFTVQSLSEAVGTNEYTLKKGFKELFGSPIFEFIKNYKMTEANKLLNNTEINISEISNRLGYKNLTHFSAAFKRKFGYPPSELKSILLKNRT